LIVGVPFSGQPRPNTKNQGRKLEGRNEDINDPSTIIQVYFKYKYNKESIRDNFCEKMMEEGHASAQPLGSWQG